MLRLLGEAGAKVDSGRKIARLPEKLVMDAVAGPASNTCCTAGTRTGPLASATAISC